MDIVKPDTSHQQQELARIQSLSIQVVDRETHDLAVSGIKQAEDYVKAVELHFLKYEKPLKDALAAIKSDKDKLIEVAKEFAKEHRRRCGEWQTAEMKRLQAEAVKEAEAKEERPWEGTQPVAFAPVTTTMVASNGASIRNKPWKARVLDQDKLWAAAIKDPRYREYFIVDEKALNAKAKSMGEAFNIPGCEAFRETTLVVK